MSGRQMFFTMAATFAVLGVTEAATSQPQRGARDPAAAFDRADSDRDGKVSRAEYVAARSARFADLDHNKDGTLSRADFPRARARPEIAARLDAMIAEADANKDGRVFRSELDQAPTPGFDRADTDRDGFVTQAELAALRASAAARR